MVRKKIIDLRLKLLEILAPQIAAAVNKFQSSPVRVLLMKEDRNIYLNDNRFLVRVSSISDFIFQFEHTLSAHLELKKGPSWS